MINSSHPIVVKKSKKGILPNLIVIGAQKCATTSLHYYLNLHPEISMSREKELNFFVLENNWCKGTKWYKSNFRGKGKVYGESSPDYTNYPLFDGVPERMRSVVPDAKLIYVVRDPIDRIVSQYVHEYSLGYESRTFEDSLKPVDRTNPYICRSLYYMQIEQYLKCFPRSSILIVAAEDLYYSRSMTLRRIFEFLSVDKSYHSPRYSLAWHKSSHTRRRSRTGLRLAKMPVMRVMRLLPFEIRGGIEKLIFFPFSQKVERPILDDRVRRELIAFLSEDVNRLREWAGSGFEGWCV